MSKAKSETHEDIGQLLKQSITDWLNEPEASSDLLDVDNLMAQQKLRQETHKANELEHRAKVRGDGWAPVAEFNETSALLLQKIRTAVIENIESICNHAGLTQDKASAIQEDFAQRFDKITS